MSEEKMKIDNSSIYYNLSYNLLYRKYCIDTDNTQEGVKMSDEVLMKCKNKECENCFACKNGWCNALTTPCNTTEGYCKFYQNKTSYLMKIEKLAKLKGLPFDTFVKQNELKEIVDNCKQ